MKQQSMNCTCGLQLRVSLYYVTDTFIYSSVDEATGLKLVCRCTTIYPPNDFWIHIFRPLLNLFPSEDVMTANKQCGLHPNMLASQLKHHFLPTTNGTFTITLFNANCFNFIFLVKMCASTWSCALSSMMLHCSPFNQKIIILGNCTKTLSFEISLILWNGVLSQPFS